MRASPQLSPRLGQPVPSSAHTVLNLVGDDWVASRAGGRLAVVNPANEQQVAAVPVGVPEDVHSAVYAARAALRHWSSTPATLRASALGALADAIERRSDEFAASVSTEMGAPYRFALSMHVALPVTVLRAYARILATYQFTEEIGNSLVIREPAGVVGAITPWSFPLHQVVVKVGAALAAGCTVVLKPSELSPMTANMFASACLDAGLPPGVVNVVHGAGATVGEAIVAHPGVDMVSFTGSSRTGRRIAQLAGDRPIRAALELGGKSANLVLPDVDDTLLHDAVAVGVARCLFNSGQSCNAWSRMLVPADRHDQAAELAADLARAWLVGDPFAPETRIGPLVSARHRAQVLAHIRAGVAEGGRLVTGGSQPVSPELGYFVEPTVFAGVRPESTIAQQEIFGPVLALIPYRDEAHAVSIANSTPYALTGAVWSPDRAHAMSVAQSLRAGQVDINGAEHNPEAPFGGMGLSGYGREYGRFGIEEFCVLKSIQR